MRDVQPREMVPARTLLPAALVCFALAAHGAPPSPPNSPPPALPAPNHPILGTWTFQFQDRDCAEIYRIYPNGRTLDTSGDEVSESSFQVSPKAGPNGFYKFVSKVIKDNGKKDCVGQIGKVGDGATNYVLFHSTGESFIMCRKPSLDACFGPVMRVHGKTA